MRTISADFRDDVESTNGGDVAVWFFTITHPDLETPLYFNSDIVDYVYGGNTFKGTGCGMPLLTDDENPPQAKFTVPNVDRIIGETVLAISDAPRFSIQVMARSDFDDSNPRQPVGTPTIEYEADYLYLRNVSCDAWQLTADIVSYDVTTEPWPKIRATPDYLPALFR